jgi:uncharacterized protein (UPF0335 family)
MLLCSSFVPISPMALLMKQMLNFLKNEKKAILLSDKKNVFPENKNEIYTAKVMKGKKLAINHKDLSNELLKSVAAYEIANDSERKAKFNLIVKNCVDCHAKVCPGPIEVIQSNIIE